MNEFSPSYHPPAKYAEPKVERQKKIPLLVNQKFMRDLISTNDSRIAPPHELQAILDELNSDTYNAKMAITHPDKTCLTGSRVKGHYISKKSFVEAVEDTLPKNNPDRAKILRMYKELNAKAQELGLDSTHLATVAESFPQLAILKEIFTQNDLAADFDVVNTDITASPLNFKNKKTYVAETLTTLDFHPSPNI